MLLKANAIQIRLVVQQNRQLQKRLPAAGGTTIINNHKGEILAPAVPSPVVRRRVQSAFGILKLRSRGESIRLRAGRFDDCTYKYDRQS